MWNSATTDAFPSITTENVTIKGHGGADVNAYFVRPQGQGPFPGIVLVHHMPGWDEFYREFARRFADHGYLVICPNLYSRFGQGSPDDIAAKVRGEGGVPDETVVGDLEGGLKFLKARSDCNGKVGIIGTCSGGRHALLTACKVQGFDAVVDLWGGGAVQSDDQLTPQRPVSPHTLVGNLQAPLLGLFGNEDQNPDPAQVNTLEEALKKAGKNYEFHRYDGAGHGFFYYDRPNYRQQQAMDGWQKVFAFFEKNLK